VRGLADVREATVDLGGRQVRVAAASGLGNARKLLEAIERGDSKYDVIEIMACPGGCINGGGQPYTTDRVEMIRLRTQALYNIDKSAPRRKAHENQSIIKLYEEFLGEPGGHRAHELLHTEY
jgi:NADH-quinone oxidoreductase subunit G